MVKGTQDGLMVKYFNYMYKSVIFIENFRFFCYFGTIIAVYCSVKIQNHGEYFIRQIQRKDWLECSQ